MRPYNVTNHPQMHSILIDSSSQLPNLLTTAIEILIRGIYPDVLSQWFAMDILRHSLSVARRAFVYILTPACTTTDTRRARAISQILSAVSFAAPYNGHFAELAEYMCGLILVRRLEEGPQAAWEHTDRQLQRVYEQPFISNPTFGQVKVVASAISSRNWGDDGAHLRVRCHSLAIVVFD